MSQQHKCKDGTLDYTDKGTPNKVPCLNNGGEFGRRISHESPQSHVRIPQGSPQKSTNKMAWIIGAIAVAGIVYFMFIKK